MIRNAWYKLKLILFGILVSVGVGSLAQVGPGSGIGAPPVSDDPSFNSLTVSGSSTFAQAGGASASSVLLQSTVPLLRIQETDGGIDEKAWRLFANSGILRFDTSSDADSVVVPFFRVYRTGTTVDEIELDATLLDFNGQVDVSGLLTVNRKIVTTDTDTAYELVETDATADNRVWRVQANGEQFRIRPRNDADNDGAPFFTVDRTGVTIDEIDMAATTLDLNGLVEVSNGAGETIRAHGSSNSASNNAWLSFTYPNGTRVGFVGDGSSSTNDLFLQADIGNLNVDAAGVSSDVAITAGGDVTIDDGDGGGDSKVWNDVDSSGNGGGRLGIAYARTNSSGILYESSNVSSVTDEVQIGDWTVNFTANTFNDDPVCSCSTVGAGICDQDGPWSSSAVSVRTRNVSGNLTDLGFTITCLSTD